MSVALKINVIMIMTHNRKYIIYDVLFKSFDIEKERTIIFYYYY